MANFNGKWVSDNSVPRENFDKLMNAVGVDKALQEKVKDDVTTVEFKVEGQTIHLKSSTTAFPDKVRNVTITAGVPYDDVGVDGSPFKSTTTIVDDNTMIDKGKNEKYGDFEYSRVINGNVMTCTTTMAGVTASYQMKRA